MDFKALVNKEGFKAIILYHLKNQAKHKLGHCISDKIKENLSSRENSSPEDIVDAVSKSILESNEFPDFLSSFLGNLDKLLEDEEKYVPKDEKRGNASQCSSASSMNTSSIDFLSPDQFQSTIHCLRTGINAEKLEALETLHRLPTLEHLTNKSMWCDVERGLHDSLSSKIIFLRTAALKLYTKMLTSSESKVVQESYLSLVKYMLQNLASCLNQNIHEPNSADMIRSSVELIAIFNKFLQNISAHWLRYPQSVIENITSESLSILSYACQNDNAFPVLTCIALCDPEAKWLKNIIYGHISRAAFLGALEKEPSILKFCVSFCNKFNSKQRDLTQNCCQNPVFVTEITHMVCFLAHLLQYCEGRNIFKAASWEEIPSCWTEVLDIVMCCCRKLFKSACFNCCVPVCNVLSEKWQHFWNHDLTPDTCKSLMTILMSLFSNIQLCDLNLIYFATQCLNYSFGCILSISFSSQLNISIDGFFVQILTYCKDICLDSNFTEISLSALYLHRSALLLVKKIFLMPSFLFLNSEVTESLNKWWSTFIENYSSKFLNSKSDLISKHGPKLVGDVEQYILDVNISLLNKPHDFIGIQDTSFEASLNILLEKILKDIKTKNSICSSDIAILSSALNSDITLKQILNKTIVFRLSSVIWQLNETSGTEDLRKMKIIFEMLVPSIFCDMVSIGVFKMNDVSDSSDIQLMRNVLLSPKLRNDLPECEDYNILLLQVLSVLLSNLHVVFCLEANFKVSELLLEQQSPSFTIDEKPIIDPESVLRNNILVKLYALGGPGERALPDDDLTTYEEYGWPFVDSYPIQELFYKPLQSRADTAVELTGELKLCDLQKVFLDHFKTSDTVPAELSFQVLQRSSNVLCVESEIPSNLNFLSLDSVDYVLHEEELVGLPMISRYGSTLKLVIDEEGDKLVQVLKGGKCLIGSDSNKLDVFVCTVYLMCKGDVDSAWAFLQTFAKTSNAFYIWFEHLRQASEVSPQRYILLHSAILELCDLIVKKALPRVFSVLQFFGVLPSILFSYWTIQCYWNYLDFSEISHFVVLNVLFSGMFSIYFFVSILKHLQRFIVVNAHNCDLITMLKKNPINNYKVCDYMNYILELSDSFSDMELKYLSKFFKDVN